VKESESEPHAPEAEFVESLLYGREEMSKGALDELVSVRGRSGGGHVSRKIGVGREFRAASRASPNPQFGLDSRSFPYCR
jgi:hypothetical protein